jgi:cation transport ATPase
LNDAEHPVARAIVSAAERAIAVPAADAFNAIAGQGVRANVEGERSQWNNLLASLGNACTEKAVRRQAALAAGRRHLVKRRR